MSIRLWRVAPMNRARIRLVLSPGGARRGWLVWCAVVLAALLAGAAASHLHWSQRLGELRQETVALKDHRHLEQTQQQTNLLLRMSEARSHELERQIDALNQGLRECQVDLAFFRKARDAKH